MGKVIMSGIVPQVVAPSKFKLDATFSNNTWEAIAWACQEKKVPETWVVGDQKTMTINGTDYAIDIIGKDHDIYSDGTGTAPLTFQMHHCYSTWYYMNSPATNVGGWHNSQIRTTHLPAIMALMPSEVQSGLKEVDKFTSAGSQSSTITTSADKLFLLSEIEVFGTNTYSFSGEGRSYEYYSAGNSAKKTTVSGSGRYWWTRSPATSSQYAFVSIWENSIEAQSTNDHYISFAFCF